MELETEILPWALMWEFSIYEYKIDRINNNLSLYVANISLISDASH